MIDRNQWNRADAFIEKYYNDKYITNYQKAEELSRKHPDRRNILAELGDAVSIYEDSKRYSAAGEPSWQGLRLLLSLMNEVFFNGILVDKDNQNIGMSSRRGFSNVVRDFMAELCELSNYDTKKPIDAFEVVRRINLPEEKTDGIVNYAIQKGWVYEPDRTFDRVNTGDPPPSR